MSPKMHFATKFRGCFHQGGQENNLAELAILAPFESFQQGARKKSVRDMSELLNLRNLIEKNADPAAAFPESPNLQKQDSVDQRPPQA